MRVAHSNKALIRLCVRQVVGNVREPRAARLELLNESERLFHRLMHGMWNISQGVQDQLVEPLQQRHRRVRNLAEVGEIGGAPKPETQNFQVSVEHGHGYERGSEKFEWALDGVQGDARHGAEGGFVVENISKDPPDDAKRFYVAVDRESRPLA